MLLKEQIWEISQKRFILDKRLEAADEKVQREIYD